MTIEWNKVTWYSKLLALILFITLPFIGFCLGVKYESMRNIGPRGGSIVLKNSQEIQTSTSEVVLPDHWDITIALKKGTGVSVRGAHLIGPFRTVSALQSVFGAVPNLQIRASDSSSQDEFITLAVPTNTNTATFKKKAS